ncbi:uncharacterized protein LOC144288648 isoform X2 [Canis aureus]
MSSTGNASYPRAPGQGLLSVSEHSVTGNRHAAHLEMDQNIQEANASRRGRLLGSCSILYCLRTTWLCLPFSLVERPAKDHEMTPLAFLHQALHSTTHQGPIQHKTLGHLPSSQQKGRFLMTSASWLLCRVWWNERENGLSLPDFCHPGVLKIWQRSAPEPEKLKLDGHFVLPCSLTNSVFGFGLPVPITVHSR